MADPAAPAMIRAEAIGAASRTVASTAVAPANDWAPSCPVRLPTWRAMTAPNGIEIRIVGIIVTLVTNQACSMNSRAWKRVVNVIFATSHDIPATCPGPRRTDAGLMPMCPPVALRLRRRPLQRRMHDISCYRATSV